jgi:hypothetical protein
MCKLPLIVLCFLTASPAIAATPQELIANMQACRQSLSSENCAPSQLSPDLLNALQRLEKLKNQHEDNIRASKPKIQALVPNSERLVSNASFATTTLSRADDDLLKMMDGSVWLLNRRYFGLSLEDVVIVKQDNASAVLFIDGNEYYGKLLKGGPFWSSGLLSQVVDEQADGAILTLANGVRLAFGDYDRYDTGWWLPPYDALIDLNTMNLWNLKKGKKVWIESVL